MTVPVPVKQPQRKCVSRGHSITLLNHNKTQRSAYRVHMFCGEDCASTFLETIAAHWLILLYYMRTCEHESRAGKRNYIPHNMWDVHCNYLSLPLIPSSGTQVLIRKRQPVGHLIISSSRFSTSSWSWPKNTQAYHLIAHLSFLIYLVCEAPGWCDHIIANQIYQSKYTTPLKNDGWKAKNIFQSLATKSFPPKSVHVLDDSRTFELFQGVSCWGLRCICISYHCAQIKRIFFLQQINGNSIYFVWKMRQNRFDCHSGYGVSL